jgi:ribosomal protein S26
MRSRSRRNEEVIFMPSKTRGRERLVNCDACGRRIPRDKAVTYDQLVVYTTDLKSADDVRTSLRREFHYCPSCGKHRHIYERKGRDAARRSARALERGDRGARYERGSGHIFGQQQKDSWSNFQPGGSKSGNSRRTGEPTEQADDGSSKENESQ